MKETEIKLDCFQSCKGFLQTRIYLTVDILAALIVGGTYLISKLSDVNGGVFIAGLEVLASLCVVIFLLLKRRPMHSLANGIMLGLFSLLLIGDLCYGYFYYWAEIGTPTRTSVLFHEVPLSLSYFLLPILYLYCMRESFKNIFSHPY